VHGTQGAGRKTLPWSLTLTGTSFVHCAAYHCRGCVQGDRNTFCALLIAVQRAVVIWRLDAVCRLWCFAQDHTERRRWLSAFVVLYGPAIQGIFDAVA